MKRSDCKLHNGLGSLAVLQRSFIGVNGALAGTTTFEATKNGVDRAHGARFDANGEYVSFTNHTLNLNECIYAGWFKADYNISNGAAPAGAPRCFFSERNVGGDDEFQLAHHSNVAFGTYIYRDGAVTNCRDLVTDVTAGTWYYLMAVISRSANFDGAKTLAIYFDGAQTASDNAALSDLGSIALDTIVGNTPAGTSFYDGVVSDPKFFENPTAGMIASINANRFLPSFGGARRRAS